MILVKIIKNKNLQANIKCTKSRKRQQVAGKKVKCGSAGCTLWLMWRNGMKNGGHLTKLNFMICQRKFHQFQFAVNRLQCGRLNLCSFLLPAGRTELRRAALGAHSVHRGDPVRLFCVLQVLEMLMLFSPIMNTAIIQLAPIKGR